MKFSIIIFVGLLITSYSVICQNQKSTNLFTDTPWKKKKLNSAILWKSYHFRDLFGARQYLNILDVDLNNSHVVFKIAYRDSLLLPTSQFGVENHGITAINGNFFHTEKGGSVCFFKANGVICDTSRTDLTESLFLDQLDDAAVVIDNSGDLSIARCPSSGWKTLSDIPTILSGGPLLIWDGNLVKLSNHSFNQRRYGRTGIGITKDNHFIAVVADGNLLPYAAGLSLPELTIILKSFGCIRAMNLDGGGSATMWIKGQKEGGVVSHPYDNKKFDNKGERRVANAIVVKIE